MAGSLAVLATGAVVTAGVVGTPAPESSLAVDSTAAAGSVSSAARDLPALSRSAERADDAERTATVRISPVDRLLAKPAVAKAIKGASTRLWTTETLNLWSRPDGKAKRIGEIDAVERVLVTGREFGERVEIVLGGRALWVTAGYLDAEKPQELGLGGSCTNGTSVPSAVSPNVKKVHAAVCANFPEITTYGTFRSDGEHSQGIAVDIMVSGDRGWEVAEFVRANHAALGVSYLIYAQKIWSVERSGEGWRGMSDRGSATANHYDHVHVTTY